MTTINEMPVAALANWFGRDGEVIDRVAVELGGCNWIGVPFGGGLGALSRFDCNQGVATDLHHHVCNLAAVASDPALRDQFMDALSMVPSHELAYRHAQRRCLEREAGRSAYVTDVDLFGQRAEKPAPFAVPFRADVAWAVDYFVVSWMGRAGKAGTDDEFTADAFSVRWKATGGSSSSRWRSAVACFPLMGDVLKRWTVVCMDAFEFLEQLHAVEAKARKKDEGLRNGVYCDPPFPTVGKPYSHNFTTEQQIQLAKSVRRFRDTRVVMRFHEHPLVRELYPESHWTYIELKSRSQGNNERAELLLINGPSLAI